MFEFLFKYPPAVFSRGRFVLLGPWPFFFWFLFVTLAAGFLIWQSRRSAPSLSPSRRITLGVLQIALVALLLLLLWHPAIAVSSLVPQQNIVAVLLDTSRSMAIADDGRSRFDEASRLLKGGLLDSLGRKFQVRTYRVGADLERADSTRLAAPPIAPVTRIARSLDAIATESSALPIGAVVLLSDGAENAGGIPFETVQHLRQSRIPVHTVGFGREKLKRDIEMETFSVPQRALAGSRLEARVTLRQSGYGGEKARISIRDGARVLANEAITLKNDSQSATLVFNAGVAGALNLSASVDPLPDEENKANNWLSRVVDVRPEKPRVLYVEGEPRWDYKFLRRAADDDAQIELVSMLRTTPNKIYRQGVKDSSELEAGFPSKPEELFAYDGLIIGSVEANWFTPAQQDMIKEFAGRRGGGVLFLGGRYSLLDGGYATTSLAEMIPVRLAGPNPTFQRVYATSTLTAAGADNALCRLVDDPARNTERWKNMPEMANWQYVGEAKPGAAVLAEVTPPGHRKSPLLVTEPFGRGRTAVLATGGMWRWQMRSEHTDRTLASFWQQMLRWLVNDSPGPVTASTPHEVLQDEDRVPLRAEVRGKNYLPLGAAVVNAHIIGPGGLASDLRLQPSGAEEGVYTGMWTAPAPGAYLAEVTAADASGTVGRDVVTFRRDDGIAEDFRTTQNRELLRRLSTATGGRYFTPSNARRLADDIAYSDAGITQRETLDLWDAPIILFLAVALRAAEWLLRRRWGVV